VTARRMAAIDAQFYWMSAKIPSDQFLLYAFDGEPRNLEPAVDEVADRAHRCPELSMRVDDGCAWAYPTWVPAAAEPRRLVRHELADATWAGCLDAVARCADEQLDIRRMPWRLHVFTPVHGVPASSGPATVAVMQVAHALADGRRASALAAWLFGRTGPVPAPRSPWRGWLPGRAIEASRTQRQLDRDTRVGLLPPPAGTRPALRTNARPAGARMIRTLVRHRSQIPGPTITLGVLGAVSTALSGYLGESAATLGAEVPMAKPGVPHAHNHFRNITVGLYPELSLQERAGRIAADLDNGRRRGEHPALGAADRAFAGVPAPLLRWGVGLLDPDAVSPIVSGNTVVSSVHRGAADLCFGGMPVTLTAGFPALSPMMGLTHGVHGIGDTIVISVHTAESAVDDVEDYLMRLAAVLG